MERAWRRAAVSDEGGRVTQHVLMGVLPHHTETPHNAPPHYRIKSGMFDGLIIDCASDTDWAQDAVVEGIARQQHELLCCYAEANDVLPSAFGAVFSSQAMVAEHLHALEPELVRSSQRLHGHVEYRLNVLPGSKPVIAGSDDASHDSHLRRRQIARNQRRTAQEQRRRLIENLGGSIERVCRTLLRRPADVSMERLGCFDILIARAQVSKCIEALHGFDPDLQNAGLALQLVGPSPPFSFMSELTDG